MLPERHGNQSLLLNSFLLIRTVAAMRADFTRGEEFGTAMRTYAANEGIALFVQSPMTRIFHNYCPFLNHSNGTVLEFKIKTLSKTLKLGFLTIQKEDF
jgi:hypothetical protein